MVQPDCVSPCDWLVRGRIRVSIGGMPLTQDHTIDEALTYCEERAAAEGISLQEVIDRLGPSSFVFVALLFGAPFLQPFSLGPLTTLGALSFMAVGFQMFRGHGVPKLPKRAAAMRIHGKGWTTVLRACHWVLRVGRRFTRERMSDWVTGDRGTRIVGVLIFVGGVLLGVPLANIPLNNTFPALMIVCACMGYLERDGLMAVFAIFWGVVSVVYFALVGVVIWFFGAQIWRWVQSIL